MMRRSSLVTPSGEPLIVVEESGGIQEEEEEEEEPPGGRTDKKELSHQDSSGGGGGGSESPIHNPYLLSPYRDLRKRSLPTPACTSGITASQVRRLSEQGGETGKGPSPMEAAFLATLSSAPAPSPGGRRHSVVTISRVPPTSLFGRGRRESIAAFGAGLPSGRFTPRKDSTPSLSGSSFNLQLDIMDDIAEIKKARKAKLKMWQTDNEEKVCEVSEGSSVSRYHQKESRRFSDVTGIPGLREQRRRASEVPGVGPTSSAAAGSDSLASTASSGIVCSNSDLITIMASSGELRGPGVVGGDVGGKTSDTGAVVEAEDRPKVLESGGGCGELGCVIKHPQPTSAVVMKDMKSSSSVAPTTSAGLPLPSAVSPSAPATPSTSAILLPPRPLPTVRIICADERRLGLKSRSNSFDVSLLPEGKSSALGKGRGSRQQFPPSTVGKEYPGACPQPPPPPLRSHLDRKSGSLKTMAEQERENKRAKDKLIWDRPTETVVDPQVIGSAIEVFLTQHRGSTDSTSTTGPTASPASSAGQSAENISSKKTTGGGYQSKLSAAGIQGTQQPQNKLSATGVQGHQLPQNKLSAAGVQGHQLPQDKLSAAGGQGQETKESDDEISCEPSSICATLKDLFVK